MRMLLIATLMVFAFSASAGLYKWVDDEGNVHYSQKRPRDKKYKRLKAAPSAPEDARPLYHSIKLQPKSDKIIAAERSKTDKIREANCSNAKENLKKYTIYRRFRDKNGNVSVVDDNERARQIAKSKKAISDFCQ